MLLIIQQIENHAFCHFSLWCESHGRLRPDGQVKAMWMGFEACRSGFFSNKRIVCFTYISCNSGLTKGCDLNVCALYIDCGCVLYFVKHSKSAINILAEPMKFNNIHSNKLTSWVGLCQMGVCHSRYPHPTLHLVAKVYNNCAMNIQPN